MLGTKYWYFQRHTQNEVPREFFFGILYFDSPQGDIFHCRHLQTLVCPWSFFEFDVFPRPEGTFFDFFSKKGPSSTFAKFSGFFPVKGGGVYSIQTNMKD